MSTVTVIGGDPTASAPGVGYQRMHTRYAMWKIQTLLSDVVRHLQVLDGEATPELLETIDQLRDTANVAQQQAYSLSEHLRGEGSHERS